MENKLSPRDWELLSAYMDGQLSSAKRQQLEARMQTNPELRAALEDLTHTRAMLRSLPRLKAPRSFRLTPEMVSQKQPKRLYPYFQFASALSSLLLVLALLTDFLGFGLIAPLSQMASQAPEAPVAVEAEVDGAPESLALEMPAEEPAEARKVDTAGEEQPIETVQVEGGMLLATPAPEMTAEAEVYLAAPAAPEEEAPDLMMEADQPTPAPNVQAESSIEMPAAEPHPTGAEMDQKLTETTPSNADGLSSMRILQIALVVVALSTAMAAIYFRRIGA